MDKRSKILIAIFIAVILISVFLTYKRSFMDQNFVIEPAEETEEEALPAGEE